MNTIYFTIAGGDSMSFPSFGFAGINMFPVFPWVYLTPFDSIILSNIFYSV